MIPSKRAKWSGFIVLRKNGQLHDPADLFIYDLYNMYIQFIYLVFLLIRI